MKTPKTLVSGGYDHSIRFWDLKTAKPIRSVPFHSSHINQVKFSLDGRLLAVCGNPLVEFYDLRTNTEKSVHTINFHSNNVTCLAFKDHGPFIATCSEDKSLGLWDLRIISPLQSWKSSFPFSCICYGRDESEIITSDYSGAARIWDIATQKESGRLKTRDSSILTGFLYERAHSLFIMFGSSGFVYISLLRPKKASASLRVEHTYVYGKSNYEVEHEAKGYFEKITKLRATKRYVLKASLSDEGLLLANANEDGDIKLWGDKNNPDAYNESRWQQQVTLGRHQKWVWDCQFLPETKYLVSASSDKKILLWNWEKRLLLQEFLGHEKTVTSLDVSVS
ncbi:G protein beta subunit-like protein [Galdieria sulphuraria]|uniref:G protein beta subunit-like protein n=1 Tax=Galdieria sulphuraria TaxID=130081 RepID=M2VZD8_GALSU|nr:G protein beta subunit-like protein [Galdieria sulphuraria]EME28696.1 G protein beta subunit-like protein [Galdieria sulphuraria]|eukprot:XP_005705216.1 G protein beta subunit-like protein [Galdieria sulphuraria]